ncbi:hypothetical protein [uncultured Aquimarina sp.]|uniref:hypothetical protein n=1 Tax=uncultured Aquimarina sp. TaxID=575652 RepID=UPI00260A5254|nr:hypothetical protein [uncultured Aquimarina sp.]
MKLINPAYGLNISSVNCQIEIRCNDVIIFEYKGKNSAKKNGISLSMPINHVLLKNGDFDIRGTVLPIFDSETLEDSSSLSLELYLMDYVAPKQTLVSLLKLTTPSKSELNNENTPSQPLKSLEGLPKYEIYSKFKAEALPFEEEGWLGSSDLSKLSYQSLLVKTYNFYRKIHTTISNKEVDLYNDITYERDKIIEKVYYYGPEKIKKEKQEIKDLVQEPGLNLLPIKFDDLKLELMGNDKLVRLIRKNNLPVLMFYNPLNRKTVQLNFKLHKKTNSSELSII